MSNLLILSKNNLWQGLFPNNPPTLKWDGGFYCSHTKLSSETFPHKSGKKYGFVIGLLTVKSGWRTSTVPSWAPCIDTSETGTPTTTLSRHRRFRFTKKRHLSVPCSNHGPYKKDSSLPFFLGSWFFPSVQVVVSVWSAVQSRFLSVSDIYNRSQHSGPSPSFPMFNFRFPRLRRYPRLRYRILCRSEGSGKENKGESESVDRRSWIDGSWTVNWWMDRWSTYVFKIFRYHVKFHTGYTFF